MGTESAGPEKLPTYKSNVVVYGCFFGALPALILYFGESPLPPQDKARIVIIAAIFGAALGYQQAAHKRREMNDGVAVANFITGVLAGPLILGLGVILLLFGSWLVAMPAPVEFDDITWKWWAGSSVVVSTLSAAGSLKQMNDQQERKWSGEYWIRSILKNALTVICIIGIAWIWSQNSFRQREVWVAVLIQWVISGLACALVFSIVERAFDALLGRRRSGQRRRGILAAIGEGMKSTAIGGANLFSFAKGCLWLVASFVIAVVAGRIWFGGSGGSYGLAISGAVAVVAGICFVKACAGMAPIFEQRGAERDHLPSDREAREATERQVSEALRGAGPSADDRFR